MKKLEAGDLKEMNLLKHYRIIRKWASKTNGLTDADLELIIYLDCVNLFTIKDFKLGTYSYSWNKIEIGLQIGLINAALYIQILTNNRINNRIKINKQRSIFRNKTFQSSKAIILPGPIK